MTRTCNACGKKTPLDIHGRLMKHRKLPKQDESVGRTGQWGECKGSYTKDYKGECDEI